MSDVYAAIARLKRDCPRAFVDDVLTLIEAYEALVNKAVNTVNNDGVNNDPVNNVNTIHVPLTVSTVVLDGAPRKVVSSRREYMKSYMAKKRAAPQ